MDGEQALALYVTNLAADWDRQAAVTEADPDASPDACIIAATRRKCAAELRFRVNDHRTGPAWANMGYNSPSGAVSSSGDAMSYYGPAQHTYTRDCDGFHPAGPCPEVRRQIVSGIEYITRTYGDDRE